MSALFVDTGYLIALEAADDQYHDAALKHWRGLSASAPHLVTTSYVFSEVVTFFNTRNRHAKAVEIGNRLLHSQVVRLLNIDQMTFVAAWRYFMQHQDKSYSLTDCISFVVMQQLDIRVALAFDRHFLQAGFAKLP